MQNAQNVKQFPVTTGFENLKKPVDESLVRQREGWRDRQGNVHLVDFVEWHTVADILDRETPDWTHTVKDIREIGGVVCVTVAITIGGVTREGIGTGTAESEMGIKKAEHDALKRAAVKFGVGRELYKKETEQIEREGAAGTYGSDKPANPIARSAGDQVTAKQLGMIRAIAREHGVDPDAECQKEFNCHTDELSKRAASYLIRHLQESPKTPPPPPQTASPNPKPNLQSVPPKTDEPENPREILAREIFAAGGVEQRDKHTYRVSAKTPDGGLEECTVITGETSGARCNCEDFQAITRRNNPKFKCEHILATRIFYADKHLKKS